MSGLIMTTSPIVAMEPHSAASMPSSMTRYDQNPAGALNISDRAPLVAFLDLLSAAGGLRPPWSVTCRELCGRSARHAPQKLRRWVRGPAKPTGRRGVCGLRPATGSAQESLGEKLRGDMHPQNIDEVRTFLRNRTEHVDKKELCQWRSRDEMNEARSRSEGGGRNNGARNLLQAEGLSDILRHWRDSGPTAIDIFIPVDCT